MVARKAAPNEAAIAARLLELLDPEEAFGELPVEWDGGNDNRWQAPEVDWKTVLYGIPDWWSKCQALGLLNEDERPDYDRPALAG